MVLYDNTEQTNCIQIRINSAAAGMYKLESAGIVSPGVDPVLAGIYDGHTGRIYCEKV